MNTREFFLLVNRKSLKAKPRAIELKIPNATNFGKLIGSIEFQGETNTETAIDVQITQELSNLAVGEISTTKEYLTLSKKAETRPPPKREPGLGSRSLSDQRGAN